MIQKRLLGLLLLLIPLAGNSTHLRAGQIRVVRIEGMTVYFELRILVDRGSEIKFGEGLLNFGDGKHETTPTLESVPIDQANIGLVVYNTMHVYATPGNYVISYLEPNLNAGILNVFNSVETRFYTETSMVWAPPHTSPLFRTNPIVVCPLGREYSFSTAAIDSTANDYYYKYSLVTPQKERGQIVGGYKLPDGMKINEDNGIVTWGTKFNDVYRAGEFLIAVKIEKFSKSLGALGYVVRTTEVIVEDSESTIALTSSVTNPSNKIIVKDGEQKKIRVVMSDDLEADHMDFEIYYNKALNNCITLSEYDSIAGANKFRVAILTLNTTSNILSDVPYPITLRGRSDYFIDITFLYFTKDPPAIPDPPIVGTEDVTNSVSVYPNPFHSEVYIDGAVSGEITLFNSVGQLVLRSPAQLGLPFDTSNLADGLYFLVVKEGDKARTFKLARH